MEATPNPPSAGGTVHSVPPPQPTAHSDPASHNSRRPRKVKSKPEPAPERSPPHTDRQTSRVSNVRDQPDSHSQHAPSPRFTAHLQPYPGPSGPPYVMNPSYPMNGSPYPSSPSPFHQPASSASSANGQSSQVGPGIPGHAPQYSYAMHHAAYTHHGYPSYPQYPPSSMMVYTTPSVNHHDTPHSAGAPSPVATTPVAGNKRKSSAGEVPSRPNVQNSGGNLVDTKKRTKTQRACDSCRSRKIRCDVLPDADPPICQHCKQYGFECTFFLPITETRFKKKKLEEEAAAFAVTEKEKEPERRTSSPQGESSSGGEVKVYGPTHPAHLLHSQAMIPSRMYESYDLRYHHAWDVSTSGEGIIRVHEPQQGELQLAMPKPIDLRIERDIVEKLVNAYFMEVAPMLPVVKRDEFLASNPPPPMLLYSICLVAAARREVPQNVFDSIRYAVNGLIKAEDVLSTASFVNLQSLLILSMVGDCHSTHVPGALSALWLRLGCAIRMAQDLGLHRAESVKHKIELRRRLWGICVISDRWISLTYGHPYMIDVRDCDARLPSSGDPDDLYMDEMVRLGVILGRVQKAIYTPAGLKVTTDDELYALLADLEAWRNNLPESLQFRGVNTPRTAGLLFMLYACVNMMFWRVFMRISYSCPAHLKFALTVEKWSALVNMTGEAIDWLDANERMYDVWLLVAYCATSCALVQYHTWARRRDADAQAKLKKLRDCVRRWEASLSPDHMSARRKTAEIITLLYEATQGPLPPADPPAINPTGGVKPKQQPPLGGLVFQKDPSRPGGGVFVAHGKVAVEGVDKNIPEGTIISSPDAEVEGEASAAAASSVKTSNDRVSLSFPSHDLAGPSYDAHWSPSPTEAGGQRQQHTTDQGSNIVNFTPLGGSYSNMNPALNNAMSSAPGNVQVMNVLDVPQASNTLEQFAMADTGFLEGIPGSMYDWGQWDNFFSRVAPQVAGGYQRAAAAASETGSVPHASGPQQNQPQSGQYQYPGS